MAAEFGDPHRLFCQSFLRLHYAPFEETKKLVKSCLDKYGVQRDGASLEGFIQTINDKLSDIDMKLVQVNDPQTCHRGFGLVNTNPDEVAKIATPYSQTEISGLKRLIQLMFDARDAPFQVGSIAAMNDLAHSMKYRKKDIEQCLDKWQAEFWICQIDGKISLHQLAIAELREYLEGLESPLPVCQKCRSLALSHSVFCVSCDVAMHSGCEAAWKEQAGRKMCPECHNDWKSVSERRRRKIEKGVGREEENVELASPERGPETDGTTAPPSTRGVKSHVKRRAEEDADDEDDDEEVPTPKQQKSRRTPTKRKNTVRDDDVDDEEGETTPTQQRGKLVAKRGESAVSDDDEIGADMYDDEEADEEDLQPTRRRKR